MRHMLHNRLCVSKVREVAPVSYQVELHIFSENRYVPITL